MSEAIHPYVPGGHAVMLDVELPEPLAALRDEWIRERPTIRQRKKNDQHLTMAFVGRDMARSVGDAMMRVADQVVRERVVPETIELSGELAMFGQQDHLVALVDRGAKLLILRAEVNGLLAALGVPHDDKRWNPHVTLAVGARGDQRPRPAVMRHTLRVRGVAVKIGDAIHTVERRP